MSIWDNAYCFFEIISQAVENARRTEQSSSLPFGLTEIKRLIGKRSFLFQALQ